MGSVASEYSFRTASFRSFDTDRSHPTSDASAVAAGSGSEPHFAYEDAAPRSCMRRQDVLAGPLDSPRLDSKRSPPPWVLR